MEGDLRKLFFLMVDENPVHPLVGWARDEIVRLESLLAEKESTPAPEPVVTTGTFESQVKITKIT